MAAALSVDPDRWRREFDELMLRVGGRFARAGPRRRMAAFVRGLLAPELLDDCRARGRALPAGDAAAAVGSGLGRGRSPG
jgi:hypothetical protein